MPVVNVLIPVGLYLLALVIRLVAAGEFPFPTIEPSAYYVGVAGNLLAGEGLVSDGVWSYATPPLEVPKPAFELWLPMSTFVSAAAMALLGSTWSAAQIGNILLGAAVAPLAWAVAREAAAVHGLDGRRGRAVAVSGGLLAAVMGPLVLGSALPDSYIPFTVFALAAALLVPRALGAHTPETGQGSVIDIAAGLGLGLAMGLAYLSRQEVIWLGLTVVLMLAWILRGRPSGGRLGEAFRRLWPVFVGGLVVVVPWLLRNTIELGSPFPGQAVENMFLVENEDIFAFADHPDAETYLGQGVATVLLNPLRAAWHALLEVVVLSPFPVGLVGLVALVGMRHSRALREPTALVVLLVSSLITFLTTVTLFPVATMWGTFMHSSGPLLVALGVVAALGADALLARISVVREWEKPNIIIGPIALVSVAALLLIFQVSVFSSRSQEMAERYEGLSAAISAVAEAEGSTAPGTVITDHPMWLAESLDGYAIALPDEDLDALVELGSVFDTSWVVVVDERGRYPEALLDEAVRPCLEADPLALETTTEPAWLFRLAQACAGT